MTPVTILLLDLGCRTNLARGHLRSGVSASSLTSIRISDRFNWVSC